MNALSSFWTNFFVNTLTPFQCYSLGTFVHHLLSFYLLNVPFIFFQYLDEKFAEGTSDKHSLLFRIKKWKDQYRVAWFKPCSKQEYRKILSHVFFKIQLFVVMPMALTSMWSLPDNGITRDRPFPSLFEIAWQLVVFMLADDFLFYWIHRILHTPALFRWIHSVHHKVHYSVSIAQLYFHPIEMLVGIYIPVVVPPMILGKFYGVHLFTFWLWNSIMLFESSYAHAGYNFPGIPLDANHHYYHHSHVVDYYGSYWCMWDWLMGTTKHYKEFTKKLEARKGAAATSPQEETTTQQ